MSFEEVNLKYQSPLQREESTKPKSTLFLSAFNVQRIIKELVCNHWLNDDPALSGYGFNQRYKQTENNLTANDSTVLIDYEFNWTLNPANLRPSIVVARGDCSITSPVIGRMTKIDPRTSQLTTRHTATMTCSICVIASPVGLVEQIAEWTAKPLLQFEGQIKNDFKFRTFRMAQMTKPQEYKDKEAKDYYIVVIPVQTVFDMNTLIVEDDLKLKTVSKEIFLNMANKPLDNQ